MRLMMTATPSSFRASRSPLFDATNKSVASDPFGVPARDVAAYAYDCVIAFAIAFSRSNDFSNGGEVAARFREARFDGATGQVQFDFVGDRDASTSNCTSRQRPYPSRVPDSRERPLFTCARGLHRRCASQLGAKRQRLNKGDCRCCPHCLHLAHYAARADGCQRQVDRHDRPQNPHRPLVQLRPRSAPCRRWCRRSVC
jgi:hypothetical protein